ncbi:MAG: hypothetical protein ACXAEX_01335 [Promethearchaeota archaeon]|jgi:hypothetical protein
MTSENTLNTKKGLPIGTNAPMIETIDVFEIEFNLTKLAQKHHGILLDFSRGAW